MIEFQCNYEARDSFITQNNHLKKGAQSLPLFIDPYSFLHQFYWETNSFSFATSLP